MTREISFPWSERDTETGEAYCFVHDDKQTVAVTRSSDLLAVPLCADCKDVDDREMADDAIPVGMSECETTPVPHATDGELMAAYRKARR